MSIRNTARESLSRRRVLRGMMAGAAVTFGLPVLECMLDVNGAAFAATGQALPPNFGTFFFALGLAPRQWQPKAIGANYELTEHLAMLQPVRAKLNIFSGMQTFLDGKANQNHYSGAQCQMTGMVSRNGSDYTTSLDTIIGTRIGKGTRFRSIEVGCDGDRSASWSARGANGFNPAEISPIALYTRIFGPDFKDPNAADFTPDPQVMVRRSVLSGVGEQRRALMAELGASDKARMDEYFSSVRDLEQQMAIQLERPQPLPACTVPEKEDKEFKGRTTDETGKMNQQFATLIAHALACGQTHVFNVSLGSPFSRLQLPDEALTYHVLTHEESVDPALQYQPKCRKLAEASMTFYRDLALSLDRIKEGEGTLLDRSVIMAFTDHGEARLHSMKNFPLLTVGGAGGRIKTGYHVAAEGDTVTRVGFTLQQAFGVPDSSWGQESNHATKVFSEVMA